MPRTTRVVKREVRRRYVPKKKFCSFCADKVVAIDYKAVAKLQRFISNRGRIEPRRRTGVCAKHQRRLSQALKRARHIALIPFTPDHIRESGGVGVRLRPETASTPSPQGEIAL